MQNCLSKCNKPFTIVNTLPITSGYNKKIANSIEKSHMQIYRYIRPPQRNKSSLIDAYERFPPQLC